MELQIRADLDYSNNRINVCYTLHIHSGFLHSLFTMNDG